MNEAQAHAAGSGVTTIHCPSCGQAMRVAPEHMGVQVACPRCRQAIDPWRYIPTMAAGQAPPTHPSAPPPSPTPPYPGAPPYLGVPGPGYGYGADPWAGYSWRNRWVAGALGILLGVFGVHRFYLGFNGIGVVQLILGILSMGIISSIWGFIEGILCFVGAMHDVDGLPLRG